MNLSQPCFVHLKNCDNNSKNQCSQDANVKTQVPHVASEAQPAVWPLCSSPASLHCSQHSRHPEYLTLAYLLASGPLHMPFSVPDALRHTLSTWLTAGRL